MLRLVPIRVFDGVSYVVESYPTHIQFRFGPNTFPQDGFDLNFVRLLAEDVLSAASADEWDTRTLRFLFR